LQIDSLAGRTFLDVGCGSGLFSLAARKLGANVWSFDYDTDSVACTESLKERFTTADQEWVINQGSILDQDFLSSLPPADVVYAWGVLHHSGAMWEAIGNACGLVKPGGTIVLSIYNDQGGASRRWRMIKKLYNAAPRPVGWLLVVTLGAWMELKLVVIRLLRFQNPLPFAHWRQRRAERGMSYWHDLVDWIGGYPFEVARPEEVFDAVSARGFQLTHLKTQLGGYGCNEFVFVRSLRWAPKTGQPNKVECGL
jgi:2-polyprenyl-6-hydroxyphenyl methylase/3-demethylubiquinone-9 3-methyltransferase